jgi:DNA integrity scanning protein DisA with diadenylate cyclase activity
MGGGMMGGKRITPEIIEKIKKLGKETKFNNIEIAGIVEVSDSTVSRVLSGYYDGNDTNPDKESPWHKKYKEITNRSVYDVICKLIVYELEDKDKE